MKKLLAVAVIILFIGLAFAPSINANISKASIDSELVEITTEICGLNGGKHTALLSKEDADEVDALFDSIRERLNATETREETEQIFNEAIVELDKYGLLEDLSIKQLELLIFGPSWKQHIIEKTSEKFQNEADNGNTNLLCLIAGRTNLTLAVHRLNPWFLKASYKWEDFWDFVDQILYKIFPDIAYWRGFPLLWEISLAGMMFFLSLWIFPLLVTDKNPISLFNVLGIGIYDRIDDVFYYGKGWVSTLGLLGKKQWDGELLGNLPGSKLFNDGWMFYGIYPAIWGFNGIKIWLNEDGSEKCYLGSALVVGLDTK